MPKPVVKKQITRKITSLMPRTLPVSKAGNPPEALIKADAEDWVDFLTRFSHFKIHGDPKSGKIAGQKFDFVYIHDIEDV